MTTVRRAGAASVTTLLGLGLTLTVVHVAAPGWARATGLDVWNLPGLMAEARASDVESDLLGAQEQQLFREIEVADHVAERLVAGTLSLDAATDEVQPLLENRTGFNLSIRMHYHAPSLRLAAARYLIARIEREPTTLEPVLRGAVLARLEEEYARMK